jgi:hypothetical protein
MSNEINAKATALAQLLGNVSTLFDQINHNLCAQADINDVMACHLVPFKVETVAAWLGLAPSSVYKWGQPKTWAAHYHYIRNYAPRHFQKYRELVQHTAEGLRDEFNQNMYYPPILGVE